MVQTFHDKQQSSRMEPVRRGNKILLVDNEADVTITFKAILQDAGFTVNTYEDPLIALSNFIPRFYDLVILDIGMPKMNGIELSRQLLELDSNVKICFSTAGEANIEVLRELYPSMDVGCFIKKPVAIDQVVKRVKAELE
ncbi:MAG TPA: response regulator [Nitrososphaeraceae archaeon]|nr:response regulator [Nitrososphaeraceae archaeon]